VKLPHFLALLLTAANLHAADPRLGPLKELDGYFPWTPPASAAAWQPRAEAVRMQLRVALGLWPEPTRTPLNAVIHGRVERDDYTVEKVFFESMPGLFVTGNLYRPKNATGPRPAVLCPHGHWEDARFRERTAAELKTELATGAERFPGGGLNTFQSLGAQLARMGVVAFVYDMLGYCDSQQISFAVAHKFAKQRPEMSGADGWGLFSPRAEAHAQSVMGLQTWNSIRALDFLTTLPDVDAKRLGCTGASGGGTQTMLLAALDPRLAVSCPAVMVSTAMQGGCTCENTSLLRIGTGNVEFAALFAPKPQGMTAANDWTKEMETKGFPELKQHYAALGAPDHVALWAHLQFPHNYNIVSREHIYVWFNRHLALGLPDDRLREREIQPFTRAELSVWDTAHPAPPGGDAFEKKLLRWWRDDTQAQLAKLSPAEFEKVARPAWRAIVGEPESALVPTQTVLIGARRGGPVILWLTERGKAGLLGRNGQPIPEVQRALDAGTTVLGVDLFQQPTAPDLNRVSKNPREAPAFTYGYNHPLFAQRVHDVLATLRSPHPAAGRPTRLVALDGTAPIAAAALALLPPDTIKVALLDTRGFRFGALTDWRAANFQPAAAPYGDLPGLLKLSTAKRLQVLGEANAGMSTTQALIELLR